MGKAIRKRKGKRISLVKKLTKANNDKTSTEKADMPSVTATEITNLEVKLAPDDNSSVVKNKDNKEEEKNEGDDRNKKVTSDKVTHVSTTEVKNLEVEQVHHVNSPDAPIVIEDNLEEENMNGKNKSTKGAKKALYMTQAIRVTKKNKDDSLTKEIVASVPSVTTTEISNLGFKQVHDVNSPNAPIFIDDDIIEEENAKGKEKSINTAKTDTKKDATKKSSNKDWKDVERDLEEPDVTITEELDINLIQVDDVDSSDEPIVLDDD